MKKRTTALIAAALLMATFVMQGCQGKPESSSVSGSSNGDTASVQQTDIVDSNGESNATITTGAGNMESSSNNGTTNTNTAEGTTATPKPGAYVRPTPNLGGKTIKIQTWRNDLVDVKKGASTFGDAFLAMKSKVENELHCVLKFELQNKETMTTNLQQNALSGTAACDIAMPIFWNTGSLLTSRAVADLNVISSIDLSASYWDQQTNDLMNCKGVQRAASNDLTCPSGVETSAVVFNKRLIQELQLENPYDLVTKNTWTITKMREMAKAATKNLDGVAAWSNNDQYGITTLDNAAFISNVLTAMNLQPVTKERGGLFRYNMTNTKLASAIKYLQSWFCEDKSFFVNNSQDAQHAQFRNGKALFYVFQLSYLSQFANMKDDYGVVPFPRDKDQKNYIGDINWNTSTLVIPIALKGNNLYNAGAVLQSIAYYSANLGEIKEAEVKGRYLRDSNSVKMFDIIRKSGIHAPHLLIASPRFPDIQEVTTGVISKGALDITQDFTKLVSQSKQVGTVRVGQFNSSISKK